MHYCTKESGTETFFFLIRSWGSTSSVLKETREKYWTGGQVIKVQIPFSWWWTGQLAKHEETSCQNLWHFNESITFLWLVRERMFTIFWHYILNIRCVYAFLHIKRNAGGGGILAKNMGVFACFSMMPWNTIYNQYLALNGFYNKRRWNIMVGNWNNRKNKLLLSTTPQNYHTKLHLLQLFCSSSNFSLLRFVFFWIFFVFVKLGKNHH